MRADADVKRSIQTLILYPGVYGWEEFTDRGSPCYNPYAYDDAELEESTETMAAVLRCMPKNSPQHIDLAHEIMRLLNVKRMSYSFLAKIVSRVLEGFSSSDEFIKLTIAAAAIQKKNKAASVTSATSVV